MRLKRHFKNPKKEEVMQSEEDVVMQEEEAEEEKVPETISKRPRHS
jgi:hypothetical protein